MEKGKYIKVTLKDGTKHVILSSNEAFYKKTGVKISVPTQAEIEKAFPEERRHGGRETDGLRGKETKGQADENETEESK
ncbi:hypothetical protein [Limibacterium fermenti]|uniref:hypothetical protein n=1 Tax=Limibacterium fermenti TaxID=3229863 RepID=UPI003A5FF254